MPTMTNAARMAEKVSRAPFPPPPPVDDAPELGGTGALGGNGGNGRGAFGAVGARDRPLETELFTVERTLEREVALAKLEVVDPAAVVLVRSSTRRDDPRRTTTAFPPVRLVLLERKVRRSRSRPAAVPTRKNGLASSWPGKTSVGVGAMTPAVGAGGAEAEKAAMTSNESFCATG
jgi:hypothetical protein